MKTTLKTAKNLATHLEAKQSPKIDYKHMLLALTVCLSSSTSFNTAYGMDVPMDLDDGFTHSRPSVVNPMDDRDEPGVSANSIFNDPEFVKLWDGIQTADTKIQEQFDRRPDGSPVTVIVGNTGAGKTTIHKYLRNKPLVARPTDDFVLPFRIHTVNQAPQERTEAQGYYRAQTLYPTFKEGYFDCPGFEDTRGIAQQIINAYSTKKAFDHERYFRILFAVEATDFGGRAGDFLSRLTQLGEMFNNNASIFNALNLVITKSDPNPNNIRLIKNTFRQILKDNNNLSSFQKEALEFLQKDSNQQITFFNKVMKEGPLDYNDQLIRGNTYIDALTGNVYSPASNMIDYSYNRNPITPKIVIPEGGREYLQHLSHVLSQEISKNLSSFYRELQDGEVIQKFITTQKGTAQELRNQFGEMVSKVNTANNIGAVIKSFNEQRGKKFATLVGIGKFLEKIDPSLSPTKEDDLLSHIATFLNPFAENITSPDEYNDQITFSGKIVGISDIIPHLREDRDIKQLNIVSSNALVIDANLTCPHTNLFLSSPFLNVATPTSINLGGENGCKKSGGRAYDGGNIVLAVDQLTNAQDLKINLSGGNGGIPTCSSLIVNGVNHGEHLKINHLGEYPSWWHWDEQKKHYVVYGANGLNGTGGSLKETLKRPQQYLVPTPNVGWFTTEKLYQSGSLGGTGTNVYEAYKGPQGGNNGSVTFLKSGADKEVYDSSNVYHEISFISEKGKDGPTALGEPGKGGLNGNPIWIGCYVEKPFSSYWKDGHPKTVNHPEYGPDGGIHKGVMMGLKPIEIGTVDTETVHNRFQETPLAESPNEDEESLEESNDEVMSSLENAEPEVSSKRKHEDDTSQPRKRQK